jgi:ComF family protein
MGATLNSQTALECDNATAYTFAIKICHDHSPSFAMPALKHLLFQHMRNTIATLLPCSCVLCGTNANALVCQGCQQQFFNDTTSRCRQCAIPLPDADRHQRCGDCISTSPHFDQTIVVCDYAAPTDQLILTYKFGHRLPIATLFSGMLRDAILKEHQQSLCDLLCPVPLGRKRLVERGYNQSLEMAKPLSHHLGVALSPQLLRRSRETARQSSLHPDDRLKNVRNAFTIDSAAVEGIRGKHIGVVDDVMTTGTTLNEIAGLLKRFGAAKVSNYVFARTPLH